MTQESRSPNQSTRSCVSFFVLSISLFVLFIHKLDVPSLMFVCALITVLWGLYNIYILHCFWRVIQLFSDTELMMVEKCSPTTLTQEINSHCCIFKLRLPCYHTEHSDTLLPPSARVSSLHLCPPDAGCCRSLQSSHGVTKSHCAHSNRLLSPLHMFAFVLP